MNPKFLPLFYLIGAALAIGAVALIFQVDWVINVLLYQYNLTFSYEWATPYWTFLRLTLALLGGIVGMNLFLMAYTILSRRVQLPPVSRAISPESKVKVKHKEVKKEQEETEEKEEESERDKDGVEIATLPLVCNKCGKVFTQPLCMFDFKSGKARLVNVCPYCNAVLAVSGNSTMK